MEKQTTSHASMTFLKRQTDRPIWKHRSTTIIMH